MSKAGKIIVLLLSCAAGLLAFPVGVSAEELWEEYTQVGTACTTRGNLEVAARYLLGAAVDAEKAWAPLDRAKEPIKDLNRMKLIGAMQALQKKMLAKDPSDKLVLQVANHLVLVSKSGYGSNDSLTVSLRSSYNDLCKAADRRDSLSERMGELRAGCRRSDAEASAETKMVEKRFQALKAIRK
ncbi:MAG: hypothetical protein K2W95_07240 [Candidatus Obscuribacterales bacterium]|nr:hypothetical protein [Candidatus Obscuribacterales bacterium]